MKQKTRKLLTAIILIFGLSNLQAQETVAVTGGEATGSGGSASYTVGQVLYSVQTGTNGNTIVQGVQQPYEISVVTGIPEAEGINLSLSVYPNPATDFLTLAISDEKVVQTKFIASLYNMQGKLMQEKNITSEKTEINTNKLTAGTYFLKIYAVGKNNHTGIKDNKKEIKTFKIVKTK